MSKLWTDEDRILLVEAKENGMSMIEIAKFHVVSVTAISNQIQKLDVQKIKAQAKALEGHCAKYKETNDDLFTICSYSTTTHIRLDKTLAFMRSQA